MSKNILMFNCKHKIQCVGYLGIRLLFFVSLLALANDCWADEQPKVFDFYRVESLARVRASQNFEPVNSKTLGFLREISENSWQSIGFKDEHRLWHDENLPFEVGFFHPGFIYDQIVTVHVVEEENNSVVGFSPSMFNYPEIALEERAKEFELGFAGLALYFPVADTYSRDKAVVFLGANHFQAVAKYADLGLTARGLILNPALPEGEQYPYFREFWLVKPQPGDSELTMYALLEAPSLTGAFKFVIKPGTSTVMEVSSTLFRRKNAIWPKKLGLAPVNGMYLYSEKENASAYDWRPEVHSADALLYSTGPDLWFHRPLNNPKRLETSWFPMESPAGFGLVQKDSNFDHYQDIGSRYDRKTWLWVEPMEDWGQGRLELIEIPSTKEIHNNIQLFWVADQKESGSQGPESLKYGYRLYWMPPGTVGHQLGRVVSTRVLANPGADTQEFILDFESDILNALSVETGLASQIETDEFHPVLEKRLVKNPVTKGWRLRFKIRTPKTTGMMESFLGSYDDSQRPSRIMVRLMRGENLPEPLTETFVYDLIQ